MKEKIAFISDIHGNLEALITVLNDIKKRGISKIVCLGDVVLKGAHPTECIKLLKENNVYVTYGNCDKFLINKKPTDTLINILRWEHNRKLVTQDDLNFLNNLPFCYEEYISGSYIRAFHATPTKCDGIILDSDNDEKKYSMFLPSKNTLTNKTADIVLYGHLHHQFLVRLYNKTLINIGSIGNAFLPIRDEKKDSNVNESNMAFYCIIEGNIGSKKYDSLDINLVRVPYNIKKSLSYKERLLEYDDYKNELENAMYRNMKKIIDYQKNNNTG